jgi:hypothetical protein
MKTILIAIGAFFGGILFALVLSQQYAIRYKQDLLSSIYGAEIQAAVDDEHKGESRSAFEHYSTAREVLLFSDRAEVDGSDWSVFLPVAFVPLKMFQVDNSTMHQTREKLIQSTALKKEELFQTLSAKSPK